MKTTITNKLGLPRPIIEALSADPYDPGSGDYSATGLLQPARMRRLQQLHPDSCVEDAADLLYRLQGQAVHTILERAASALEADEEYVVERRFYKTYVVDGVPYNISAQIDVFDVKKRTLSDYKNSSVYALSHGLKAEHNFQVNLQAELMRHNGIQVEKAEIVGIFRDYSASRAESDSSYPQAPAVKIPVPLMLPQELDLLVAARIRAHVAAGNAVDQSALAPCSDEETWARTSDDKFAVTKAGAGRASKLCSSREEADAYVSSRQGEGLVVESRLGAAVRCATYCPAKDVCEQWKKSPRNPANQQGAGKPSKRTPRVLPEGFEEDR